MSRKPIRITFVVRDLAGGGVERVVSTALGFLDRRRFLPSLALFKPNIVYPLPEDVEVFVLGQRDRWHIPRAIWRLKQVIDEWRPDIVLSGDASVGVIVREALRLSRVQPAWVSRIANNPRLNETGLFGRWVRSSHRRADLFIPVARRLGHELAAVYPETRDRIRPVLTPVDFAAIDRMVAAEPAPAKPERPTVVALGRLAQVKRYDVMLDAFAQVRRQRDACLWICGSGPLRGALERQIASLGLSDDVTLLGFCANPFAWVARADLFVLSSDMEGLPNALIEAQGLGLAAVATACPFGPDEILAPGETGLLVPVADAAALAEAIGVLLGDPARRAAMARAARQRARQMFSIEGLGGELMDALDSALACRREPRRP